MARDLGSVGADVERIVNANRKRLVRGSEMLVRGQLETMRASFRGLVAGLIFAIVLVYLLIVVNFQSLARSVHHHHGAAGGPGGNRAHAVYHPHDAQRARDDGRDHVHGGGHGQQHSGDLASPRTCCWKISDPVQAALCGRIHALPPGAS